VCYQKRQTKYRNLQDQGVKMEAAVAALVLLWVMSA
jgi:hypothetical protein